MDTETVTVSYREPRPPNPCPPSRADDAAYAKGLKFACDGQLGFVVAYDESGDAAYPRRTRRGYRARGLQVCLAEGSGLVKEGGLALHASRE